jgi:hypothetical protein
LDMATARHPIRSSTTIGLQQYHTNEVSILEVRRYGAQDAV